MKRILSFIILASSVILFQPAAFAQPLLTATGTEGLNKMTDTAAQTANFGNIDVGILVARIIQIALSFLAIIFLILIVVAGFNWMTAGGNEEQIKTAQSRIKNAVIGLVIVLMAYAITYFVFKYLPFGGVSGPQGGTSG